MPIKKKNKNNKKVKSNKKINVNKTKKTKTVKKSSPKIKKIVENIINSTLPIKIETATPVNKSDKAKKSPRKTRSKTKEKMYFTEDTENAIVEYNQSSDIKIRNDIYNEKIKYSFEKLVENIFNTFKFCYFETGPLEVQKETVSHLVANIHKFEKGKGKAFSYFSIIAKNYLIFQNNSNYKRFNQHIEIGEDNSENTCKLQKEDSHYKEEENREFINLMVNYWEKNINKLFAKQRDINIANAIIELFRNSDRIDSFNKKALYLYIREISSCKTQQITKVINKMKNYQNNITKAYVENGNI